MAVGCNKIKEKKIAASYMKKTKGDQKKQKRKKRQQNMGK